MARRRNFGRKLNGILLLDKPAGSTSNQALQKVKQLFRAQKAGHTGSLDPLATGLLPICFGEATKISSFLLSADKSYRSTSRLGVKTDSGDSDGNVIAERPVIDVSEEKVTSVLQNFKGDIQQIPPMHSAIKRNGVPLYKLAHQGLEVEREARAVTIHDLSLDKLSLPNMQLFTHCSKGTYIRTLVEDIGEQLGCGAHITALRRESLGPFKGQAMVTMEQLEQLFAQGRDAMDAVLLDVEQALAGWPDVKLPEQAAFYIQQGQAVFVPNVKAEGWVRLYYRENQFLGVGYLLDDGRVAPKRLMNQAKIS